MSFLSSTGVESYPGQSVESATGTISSLLLAVLSRARRITGGGNSEQKTPSFALRGSMSRIPASEVRSVDPEVRRKTHMRPLKNGNPIQVSRPQPIVPDSVPMVHDRLPDPLAWNKIDTKLEKMENNAFTASGSSKGTVSQRSTRPETAVDASSSVTTSKSSTTKISSRPSPKAAKRSRRTKRNSQLSPQMAGVLRRRQMYCSTGFHVQIMKDGRVTSTRTDHEEHAILEFISVGVGLVSIRGVVSGLYLAMDSRGRLYGSDGLCEDCKFREKLQENWYNTYSSTRHTNRAGTKPCLVSLGRKHRSRHGCRINDNHRSTHFLPRAVDPERVPSLYQGILY
uniref:Fibroblast growth factor n=1 Tax=Phallusia mammillata TaxID=59560 RepID=A0A6F9DDH1_9ASCI|nr:Fgf9/16/20 fibroblast growth factor 9/16/20 [Phallusia mammillata]